VQRAGHTIAGGGRVGLLDAGMRERDLIEWIRSQGCGAIPDRWVGPGDDCAIVTVGEHRVLITTDQVVDGVHVRVDRSGPRAAGRKALARNLSDVAAMAAQPLCATATVSLPKTFGDADAQAICEGLWDIGAQFNCPLVGGDVAVADGPLVVSVTVLARPDGIEPVLRSGAQPGDALCVTGELGGAWKTGRDLTFTPRIAAARALAQSCDLHAMIDLSDGLATDLRHLCAAAGVGAEVTAEAIPVHTDAGGLAEALGDGEDYELLFALPGDQADRLTADQPLDVHISRIGDIVAGDEVVLIGPDGRRVMPQAGWEHTT